MNDLVSEYQQYQDATAEEEGEFEEEEAWSSFIIISFYINISFFKFINDLLIFILHTIIKNKENRKISWYQICLF